MVENRTTYHFGPRLGQLENMRSLCGVEDENLEKLEQLLSVRLILRGQAITIQSADKEKRLLAYHFFSRLEAAEEAHETDTTKERQKGTSNSSAGVLHALHASHAKHAWQRLGDQWHWQKIYESLAGEATQLPHSASLAQLPHSASLAQPPHSASLAQPKLPPCPGQGELPENGIMPVPATPSARATPTAPTEQHPEQQADIKKPVGYPVIFSTERGRAITARSKGQQDFVDSLFQRTVTVCLGPAGTGKTYLSIAVACNLLVSRKRDRLILTRPAVEAGESLGFLPGDLQQKIDPYLRPLSDALVECLGMVRFQRMSESGQIEVLPLAYMRGRTLGNAVVILDEAQNCTAEQLKMFLTRLGYRASFCINGDITQIDIQSSKSGLEKMAHQLRSLPEVALHRLGAEDIIRHPLVKKILDKLS